ncbi:Veg family protein [Lactobacillus sp. YT155]|uniref:Veg family protein n=1 Tax=Lactobacillus sp. YT155 TaxID=3060955 RepID=UPI00265FBE21|nr:Veg family protein [Lactobacillus sp. YT155]MDO1604622.1 Veg family protein [Lactobacillus sp. YT155]
MPTSLAKIKDTLDEHIGENLTVVAQAGRKKVIRRKGKLAETFHSVFVVDLDQDENAFERVSYSYADLLTKSIDITFESDQVATEQ